MTLMLLVLMNLSIERLNYQHSKKSITSRQCTSLELKSVLLQIVGLYVFLNV